MAVPFLDLAAQYRSLKPAIDRAIQGVIDQSAFALGPAVEAFELSFAEYCGVAHCIGVGSGTAALELILRATIGRGDEVITVANSFFASAEAIALVGGTPVLVDCSEEDALMDVRALTAAITPRTKAIMPVHLFGQPADMDAIHAIAAPRKILVVEDACQAHGARYNGKRAGSLAHAAAFSFYPGKNLGAFGEAGAVTTDDRALAEKVRMLRDHGMPKKYRHQFIGSNHRMDGIQGAVLSVKLPHVDEWNTRRRTHAERYRSLLSKVAGVTLFKTHPDREQNEHLFVVRVPNRDAVQAKLAERNIATGIHYPIPIHRQQAYMDAGFPQGKYPVSERLAGEILSLPMFAEMTDGQMDDVCGALERIVIRN